MGDLGIQEAFSAITYKALLEALVVVLAATALTIAILNALDPKQEVTLRKTCSLLLLAVKLATKYHR